MTAFSTWRSHGENGERRKILSWAVTANTLGSPGSLMTEPGSKAAPRGIAYHSVRTAPLKERPTAAVGVIVTALSLDKCRKDIVEYRPTYQTSRWNEECSG